MNPTKVIVERDVRPDKAIKPFIVKNEYELWWDSGLEEWAQLFATIMVNMGFTVKQVHAVINKDFTTL